MATYLAGAQPDQDRLIAVSSGTRMTCQRDERARGKRVHDQLAANRADCETHRDAGEAHGHRFVEDQPGDP